VIQAGLRADKGQNYGDLLSEEEYLDILDTLPKDNQHLPDEDPANSSHCMAHIFWDSLSTNTFLLIGNIPQSVSDKQFQLWALMDNQPINLGVFDSKKEGQLIQMANVDKAKDFVITMEQKGGSLTPTMEALYAIGKL
jgi:hypothetical protein